MNIQDWFSLGWTGWISLQSQESSRPLPSGRGKSSLGNPFKMVLPMIGEYRSNKLCLLVSGIFYLITIEEKCHLGKWGVFPVWAWSRGWRIHTWVETALPREVFIQTLEPTSLALTDSNTTSIPVCWAPPSNKLVWLSWMKSSGSRHLIDLRAFMPHRKFHSLKEKPPAFEEQLYGSGSTSLHSTLLFTFNFWLTRFLLDPRLAIQIHHRNMGTLR